MVNISNQEILLMLRAYQEHPCSWIQIIANIKENMHTLPEEARNLYHASTSKQLKNRLSGKLSKLLAMKENDVTNVEIRTEIEKIKELERKLQKQRPPMTPVPDSKRDNVMESLSSDEEPGPSTEPKNKKRKAESDNTENEDVPLAPASENIVKKKKKAPVMELVRENQLEYNRFIKKKMPKLLKAFGVSSSEESD